MSAKKDFIAAKIAEFKQLKPEEPAKEQPAQEEANIELTEDDDNIATEESAQELSEESEDTEPRWKFEVIRLKCH